MGLTPHEYRMDLVRVTKKTITQQKSSGLKGLTWSLGQAALDARALNRETQDKAELQLLHWAATAGPHKGLKVLWLT